MSLLMAGVLKQALVQACIGLLASLFVAAAAADDITPIDQSTTTDHVSIELIAEHTTLAPGAKSTLALKISHAPGWHTYWRTPGDSGLPTTVEWSSSPEVQVGEVQWPAPKRLPYGPLVNFGYEGEAWLLADIRVPTEFQADTLTLDAAVEWLVCKEVCIPENGNLRLRIPVSVGAQGAILDSGVANAFTEARKRLPREARGWNLIAEVRPAILRLQVEPPPLFLVLRK